MYTGGACVRACLPMYAVCVYVSISSPAAAGIWMLVFILAKNERKDYGNGIWGAMQHYLIYLWALISFFKFVLIADDGGCQINAQT